MENLKDIISASFDAVMNNKYKVFIDGVENQMTLSELNIYCSMNSIDIESINIKIKDQGKSFNNR